MPEVTAPAPAAAASRVTAPDITVAIIGTGFGGIGTAARLRRAGLEDVVLLERATDLGGTWRDNAYPGDGLRAPDRKRPGPTIQK